MRADGHVLLAGTLQALLSIAEGLAHAFAGRADRKAPVQSLVHRPLVRLVHMQLLALQGGSRAPGSAMADWGLGSA